MIDCAKHHYYGVQEGNASIYFIHFNGPTLSSLYNYLTEYNGVIRRKKDGLQVGDKIKIIFDLLNDQSSIINGQQLSLLIYELILSYNQDYHKTVITEEGVVNQAIKYVHEHMDKNISLEDISSHVGLSRYHFSHRFKQETGISPIKYIKGVKLNRAKELLKLTDLTIKEIGKSIGYDNQNSFSQIFKNEFKISPTIYRRIY